MLSLNGEGELWHIMDAQDEKACDTPGPLCCWFLCWLGS